MLFCAYPEQLLDPRRTFFRLTACKKLRLVQLSRKKIGNVLFQLKIRILRNRNLRLNVWRKTFVISLGGKKSGLMHFTTTVN